MIMSFQNFMISINIKIRKRKKNNNNKLIFLFNKNIVVITFYELICIWNCLKWIYIIIICTHFKLDISHHSASRKYIINFASF